MADIQPVLVAVEADPHINSKAGLPPGVRFQLHKQDGYTATPSQRKVWRYRETFWKQVQEQKEATGLRLAVILMGDILDINKHDQLDPISKYRPDVEAMGTKVYEPIRAMADYFFVLRGTEAHTGEWCELEEWLADDLDATPDEVNKTASWGWLWATLGGTTVYAKHKARRNAHRPWTQAPATAYEQQIIRSEFFEDGITPPDVAFVAHFHWYDQSGGAKKPQVYRCPSWKLLDGLGEKMGAQRVVQTVGALLFKLDNGRVTLWPDGKPYLKPIKERDRPWAMS